VSAPRSNTVLLSRELVLLGCRGSTPLAPRRVAPTTRAASTREPTINWCLVLSWSELLIQEAFLAAGNGDFERVEELLDSGVPVAEVDDSGNTLLLLACQQGNKRLAKFLLRRGADVNARNILGNTALHYTMLNKFCELSEYLISEGCDDSVTNHLGLTCYEGISKNELQGS
jgi:ankyrin repeat protein